LASNIRKPSLPFKFIFLLIDCALLYCAPKHIPKCAVQQGRYNATLTRMSERFYMKEAKLIHKISSEANKMRRGRA